MFLKERFWGFGISCESGQPKTTDDPLGRGNGINGYEKSANFFVVKREPLPPFCQG
jgi:hypothetical protein